MPPTCSASLSLAPSGTSPLAAASVCNPVSLILSFLAAANAASF